VEAPLETIQLFASEMALPTERGGSPCSVHAGMFVSRLKDNDQVFVIP